MLLKSSSAASLEAAAPPLGIPSRRLGTRLTPNSCTDAINRVSTPNSSTDAINRVSSF
ncbi:hypothetical protein [Nostoc sp.]|uniref:hypothetical protein n=1 Tax=Nostoc sp. TaxID=1180 RepID=UPI002FF74B70